MNNLVKIGNQELKPILYHEDKPVVTFAMVDRVHEKPEGSASRRFRDNRKYFDLNDDYYVIDYSKKGEFRRFDLDIPTRGLIVLSETGYLLLVKSFTDDLAWRVQKQLVKSYFAYKAQSEEPDLPPELIHSQMYARLKLNELQIPVGFFSIISIAGEIILAFAKQSHVFPDDVYLDISIGITFPKWCKAMGIDISGRVKYLHKFNDGRPSVEAWMYPDDMRPVLDRFMKTAYIPTRLDSYLEKKDIAALPYYSGITTHLRPSGYQVPALTYYPKKEPQTLLF